MFTYNVSSQILLFVVYLGVNLFLFQVVTCAETTLEQACLITDLGINFSVEHDLEFKIEHQNKN